MTAVQEFERLATSSRFQFLCFATRILRNQADAEDAVQRALMKGWSALGAHTSRGTLTAWLYAILGNECKLLLRHRRRVKRVAKEYCRTYCDPNPEQLCMQAELARVLHYEIRRLPRNFQRVLWADLASTEEGNRGYALGALTGKNTGAAKSLLNRARKGLRERMVVYFGAASTANASHAPKNTTRRCTLS